MTQIFLVITEAIRPPLKRTRFPLTPPTKLSRTMYRVEPTHADEISDNPDLSGIETDSTLNEEDAKTIMDAVDCYSEKPAESTPDTHYRQKTKVHHESEPVITGGREYRERSNVRSFPKSPVPNTPMSYRSSRERIEAEAASANSKASNVSNLSRVSYNSRDPRRQDRKSTRLNSSHLDLSRMPSSA